MKQRTCSLVIAVLLCSATAAFAQDQRKTGLVVAAPTAVGVIWHVTNRVAIRPDFTFSTSRNESSFVGSDAESHSVGFNVSALFYVRTWGDVRAYVSPSYSYTRSSTTIELPFLVPTLGAELEGLGLVLPRQSSETTTTASGIAGMFGAQYSFGERFGIFGEAGVAFATIESESAFSPLSARESSRTGTRTAVGVVLYF